MMTMTTIMEMKILTEMLFSNGQIKMQIIPEVRVDL